MCGPWLFKTVVAITYWVFDLLWTAIEENCTKFNTKNQVFTEYFALSSLVANVQPDGFLVRLPLYIRSIGSAQIQLSSDFDTGKRQYYIFGRWNKYGTSHGVFFKFAFQFLMKEVIRLSVKTAIFWQKFWKDTFYRIIALLDLFWK